ncbi:hypothetical protein [Oceanisphaera ostreae]|uniref:Histone H1 n=1 Tax=Oceanisphaera ostreae TaxID=914151 RepID=A0ABW3KIP4_9GAMM
MSNHSEIKEVTLQELEQYAKQAKVYGTNHKAMAISTGKKRRIIAAIERREAKRAAKRSGGAK